METHTLPVAATADRVTRYRDAIRSNIRAEVARSGMRQTHVASAIGMSESTWHRRMSGGTDWTGPELLGIARALSIPTSSLLLADDVREDVPA